MDYPVRLGVFAQNERSRMDHATGKLHSLLDGKHCFDEICTLNKWSHQTLRKKLEQIENAVILRKMSQQHFNQSE